jgi:hypothetical protein
LKKQTLLGSRRRVDKEKKQRGIKLSRLSLKELGETLYSSTPSKQFFNWLEKLVHNDRFLTAELLKISIVFSKILKSKGKAMLVKIVKEIKIILDCYLNDDLEIQGRLSYNKLSYDYLPNHLRPIFRFLRKKDPTVIITIGSFLSFTRMLIREKFSLDEGLDTIKTVPHLLPERAPNAFQLFTAELHGRSLSRETFTTKPSYTHFHVSSKSGPLGVNALLSSFWDLENLPNDLTDAIYILGGSILEENMKLSRSHITSLKLIVTDLLTKRELKKLNSSKRVRSIIRFGDPEMKLRVVALGDFYSQTSLKPLHDKVTDILKTIPQDQSFGQGEGLSDISQLSLKGNTTFYCYDLTAFTDTFPFQLIKEWVSHLWGPSYADALEAVMTGQDFEIQGTTKNIRYETGNPMGFYGSFVLTSLLHHFIFFECCLELGITWSDALYKLLGDDVLIWDEKLAKCYYKRLATYNVKVSVLKTLIGKNLFEFAKRKFYLGVEVSPISYKSWLKASESIAELVEFNRQYMERGAFTKGFYNNIFDLTIQSRKIMTDTDRPKDERYLTNLINFELLVLNNKRDNINVGRIISATLAPNSQLLPTNVQETEESKEILFGVFHVVMRKKLEESLNHWLNDDGFIHMDLRSYLTKLLTNSSLTVLRDLPDLVLRRTPLCESFEDIISAISQTLLFVQSNFKDSIDSKLVSNWYQSILQCEGWLTRKTAKKKADFRFNSENVNFSKFSKVLRNDILVHFKANNKLQSELINSIPLVLIK